MNGQRPSFRNTPGHSSLARRWWLKLVFCWPAPDLIRAAPWHYPRPELAKKYLEIFDIGLTSARGLFAKRRMGKSEFLEQDLIPAAQVEGYLTVYLNLWDARTHTTPSLVSALSRAMEPTGLLKLVKRLNTPLKKVKASGKVPGLAEGSLEAELADDPAVAGPLLSELLRGFDKPTSGCC